MNIVYKFIFFVICCSWLNTLNAQNKYIVHFKDKHYTQFDPYKYFDKKTIERRLKFNIPLNDISDYPVNEEYLNKILTLSDSFTVVSRWFNCVFIYTDNARINIIKSLSCIEKVEEIRLPDNFNFCNISDYEDNSNENINTLNKQLLLFSPEYFYKNNISGKGVRIAVFDGGFPYVDTHQAFKHLRNNDKIIKTYDFVKKRDFVYAYNKHGSMVLSCIAGIWDDKIMGLAVEAEFLLARTEKSSEPYAEEEYWLAAAEWADKNGADIINSSLGYTYHRYFYKDMNGQKSLVARAANMAAKKGILVVNAAGNDGNTKWLYVNTPGDADSVLTVGGIDIEKSNLRIGFSSMGPTYNKRLKPNVCASGKAITASKKGFEINYGTSFASPLVAGFAACVKQMYPDSNNMAIFRMIEHSASLYPYYDYYHGYGVPNANKLVEGINAIVSFDIEEDEEYYKISVHDNFKCLENEPLYYHIANKNGHIEEFFVIKVCSKTPLKVKKNNLEENKILRVHYKGYSKEISR